VVKLPFRFFFAIWRFAFRGLDFGTFPLRVFASLRENFRVLPRILRFITPFSVFRGLEFLWMLDVGAWNLRRGPAS
jgi:hypothetical protein